MERLASALLQEWWNVIANRQMFIEAFGDDDFITDHYESIMATMEEFDPVERQAVRDAARHRLHSEIEVDTFGHTRASLLTPEARQFLESLIDYPEPGDGADSRN